MPRYLTMAGIPSERGGSTRGPVTAVGGCTTRYSPVVIPARITGFFKGSLPLDTDRLTAA